jgi:hypothetical protein
VNSKLGGDFHPPPTGDRVMNDKIPEQGINNSNLGPADGLEIPVVNTPASEDRRSKNLMDIQKIDHRFILNNPEGTQQVRIEYLRKQIRMVAEDFIRNCADSRERSIALTKLEEAIMWANAAIARN